MAKNKHKTAKFTEQMNNVMSIFDSPDGYLDELGINKNDNSIYTSDELSQKNNTELIQYLYNQLRILKNTNTQTIMDMDNNLGVNYGAEAERIESRISEVVTVLTDRKNNTPFNRTEGRKLQYAMHVINAYTDAQNVLNTTAEPFNYARERVESDNNMVDYETAQATFTNEVSQFNQFVNSEDFNGEYLSENVKATLNGGDLTPESLVDVANLNNFETELNNQIESEKETLRTLTNQLNHELEEAKKAYEKKIKEAKEPFVERSKSEGRRHAQALNDIDNRTREAQIIYNSDWRVNETQVMQANVGKIKAEEFASVSDQYKINVDETAQSTDIEMLKQKNSAIVNSLNALTEQQAGMDAKIRTAESELIAAQESDNRYNGFEKNVEDSSTYKNFNEYIERDQSAIMDLDSVISALPLFGIEELTPEFLREHKLDYQMPVNTKRDANILKAVHTVYDKIGKGIRWTDEGRNLNASVKQLYDAFTKDFETLGVTDALNQFDLDEPVDDGTKKPFIVNDDLKYNFTELMVSIENNIDDKYGLDHFGYITDKTGKNELQCISKLIKNKDCLKAFAESIDPSAVDDPEKQAQFATLKKTIQDSLPAIEKLAELPEVQKGLSQLNKAMELNIAEDDIKNRIIDEFLTRKDNLQKKIDKNQAALDKHIREYPEMQKKIKDRLEQTKQRLENLKQQKVQNQKDIEYLQLASDITGERVKYSEMIAAKTKASSDLNKLKDAKENENLLNQQNLDKIAKDARKVIDPINTQEKSDMATLEADNNKKLAAQNKKIEKLTQFSDRITRLKTAKTNFNAVAPRIGNSEQHFNEQRNAAIDNITHEQFNDLRNIDTRLRALFNEVANSTRPFRNSPHFNRMITQVGNILTPENQAPDVAMTAEEYRNSLIEARAALDNYISLRNRNNNHRRSDVGQLRLDGAYEMRKLLQTRENMISQYHAKKNTLQDIQLPTVRIKTKAEEALLSKCENQPNKEQNFTRQPSVVGNSKMTEKLASLTQTYADVNPILMQKFNEQLTAVKNGNGSAVNKLVATAVALKVEFDKKPQGALLNQESSDTLVNKLTDYNCVKSCTEDLLSGHLQPENLLEKLQSEDFTQDLTTEIAQNQPQPQAQQEAPQIENVININEPANFREDVNEMDIPVLGQL